MALKFSKTLKHYYRSNYNFHNFINSHNYKYGVGGNEKANLSQFAQNSFRIKRENG